MGWLANGAITCRPRNCPPFKNAAISGQVYWLVSKIITEIFRDIDAITLRFYDECQLILVSELLTAPKMERLRKCIANRAAFQR